MERQSFHQISKQIAHPLESMASPQRMAVLLAIGQGEACVCHLETALGWKQAYISQHLMALRRVNILADRREGRYVFFRLKDLAYLDLITKSAELSGVTRETLAELISNRTYQECTCPHCVPVFVPASSLQITRQIS
jgi:DNA-binding transcriptional ArsR family regulator